MSITTHKPLVQRVIRWYDKHGSDFVGEKVLDNVNLSNLQNLFRIELDNPMYECYPIESFEQENYLDKTFSFKLNTEAYDYFMECDAI
ncbi:MULTISPECIES: hypothetical protein [unclassified Nostoc]|uniref:DUF7683 domain-containing protein n=1 Tax=unclassified Nostoc TaxID=2593658 RepID=UPI002AD53B74|nr:MULTISPECIES: hypothetical protein [unclassified Nostoc]MDZ8129577.1 hypothetical protein [Nostoc sp. DedQUE07]MDZ8214072.1 hypothetical protein [Nostoc sp. ChiSLP03a]